MKYPFKQRIDEREGVTSLTADRLHSGSNQDVGFGGGAGISCDKPEAVTGCEIQLTVIL
jgi:hypothetical protein